MELKDLVNTIVNHWWNTNGKDVEIGIFGGTGIYDSGLLENTQEIEIDTPYG